MVVVGCLLDCVVVVVVFYFGGLVVNSLDSLYLLVDWISVIVYIGGVENDLLFIVDYVEKFDKVFSVVGVLYCIECYLVVYGFVVLDNLFYDVVVDECYWVVMIEIFGVVFN